TDRLHSLARYEHADLSIGDEAADEIELLRRHVERLRAENEALREKAERFQKLDAEAATHVETVICTRTNFTGEPPYVGWEGLGLALREALDERDRLRAEREEVEQLRRRMLNG